MRIGMWIGIVCILASLAPAGGDPDFSGTWKLSREDSVIRALPEPPSEIIVIDHQAPRLRCSLGNEEKNPQTVLEYSTDGTETRNALGKTRLKSILKWEGAVLLFNTLASGAKGNYAEMDRWRLSRDGKRLRIRRQVVSRHGEMESSLVYEKQ